MLVCQCLHLPAFSLLSIQAMVVNLAHSHVQMIRKNWDRFYQQSFRAMEFIKTQALKHVRINQTLKWRHNERHGVSNHQPHDCLLKRLPKETKSSASLAFVWGIHRWMIPLDDIIMISVGMDQYVKLYSISGQSFLQTAHIFIQPSKDLCTEPGPCIVNGKLNKNNSKIMSW